MDKLMLIPDSRHLVRRSGHDRRFQVEKNRTTAKVGMALSLGVAVATGLMDSRRARALHVISGVTLVGFSFWHYSLYPPVPQNNKR